MVMAIEKYYQPEQRSFTIPKQYAENLIKAGFKPTKTEGNTLTFERVPFTKSTGKALMADEAEDPERPDYKGERRQAWVPVFAIKDLKQTNEAPKIERTAAEKEADRQDARERMAAWAAAQPAKGPRINPYSREPGEPVAELGKDGKMHSTKTG